MACSMTVHDTLFHGYDCSLRLAAIVSRVSRIFSQTLFDSSVHNLIDRVTGFSISLDRLSLMQRRLSYG